VGNDTTGLDIGEPAPNLLADVEVILNLLDRAVIRQALDHLDYFLFDGSGFESTGH